MQELLQEYQLAIIKGDIQTAEVLHRTIIRRIEESCERLKEIE